MSKQGKNFEKKDEKIKPLNQNSSENTYSEANHDVKILLEWEAPGRPFIKRERSYYATTLVIMFFIEVLLFLFSQYMLMLVVVSLVFLAFAFASVPPHNFKYRISSEGIFIEDHFMLWQELYDFYFMKQNGQEIPIIRTRNFFPGEVYLTPTEDIPIEKIKRTLLPYLPYREYIKPTFVDKASGWMSKNFPLEPVPPKKSVHKVAS